MPVLNFQPRFVSLVASGAKRQTIRRPWKRPPRVGQTLYFYVGTRTPACWKIGQAECLSVQTVAFDGVGVVRVDDELVPSEGLDAFAREDGFANWREMERWFSKHYGLPFDGILIRW